MLVTNPFATLNPTAFRSLAKKHDITKLLLIRLRDRAIVAATIPRRFVQGLATELGATAEAVMDYLQSPPAMVSGHSFRSTVKPAVTEQISFTEAIEMSQLTPAQLDALKALLEENPKDPPVKFHLKRLADADEISTLVVMDDK